MNDVRIPFPFVVIEYARPDLSSHLEIDGRQHYHVTINSGALCAEHPNLHIRTAIETNFHKRLRSHFIRHSFIRQKARYPLDTSFISRKCIGHFREIIHNI